MKGNCGECERRWFCYINPDECDAWPDPVPMTNADHIRSMTDEELGSVLFGALGAVICPNGCDNCDGDCDRHTMDWLNQPYKEDK